MIILPACAPSAGGGGDANSEQGAASPVDTPLRPATPKAEAATGEWRGENGTLTYFDAESGTAVMQLACRASRLTVTLPGVRPIASEERLSFGGGGDIEVLVADAETEAEQVTANGPVDSPDRLRAFLEAGPGASYGATAIGPLVPVPSDQSRALIEDCTKPAGT